MCKQSKNEQCRNRVSIEQYFYLAIWVTMKAKGQVLTVDLKNIRVVNLKKYFSCFGPLSSKKIQLGRYISIF